MLQTQTYTAQNNTTSLIRRGS